ncbi:MAG TPA: hypothetical protein VKQ09_04555 [Sphingomonas sp.]|nr:hypothetical protein [Sphingomonas sp.]
MMDKEQDALETLELGVASEETRGNGIVGFELSGGHPRTNGISDLD